MTEVGKKSSERVHVDVCRIFDLKPVSKTFSLQPSATLGEAVREALNHVEDERIKKDLKKILSSGNAVLMVKRKTYPSSTPLKEVMYERREKEKYVRIILAEAQEGAL